MTLSDSDEIILRPHHFPCFFFKRTMLLLRCYNPCTQLPLIAGLVENGRVDDDGEQLLTDFGRSWVVDPANAPPHPRSTGRRKWQG